MAGDSKKRNVGGMIAIGLSGVTAVGLLAASYPFISPAFRKICLPYVPATESQVKNVIKLLRNRRGSLLDLGSGDGRIVIEAANAGFKAHGVELNLWLILFSRIRAMYLGLNKTATFSRQDIWKTDLKAYNNIVIFGVEQMMVQLERKFSEELLPGSCVIACRFPLPNWKPHSTIESGIDTVWLYEKR